jgi:hypothetical protein
MYILSFFNAITQQDVLKKITQSTTRVDQYETGVATFNVDAHPLESD